MKQRRTGGHREALLLGTALCLVFGAPASAQLLPNARPQGGTVSAGTATIARTPANTAINQTTSRAVIDWSGFDVGRNQSVTFVQPSATATTLNRVNAAEPSQIAGRITANGQIIIENRSGIVFADSAQVDARALVATASGIATDRFMAGSTRFDIPAKPGAAVINRGRITVAETGLAALVAPNVTNSGVIEARLGRVVLAGAATHTLDLYGDGLLSIDVGTDGKVVNTGTIRAEGGRVLLTAAAADGIVTTLVEAGGHISADSAAGRPGSVRIQATGGSIVIEGTLSAAGLRPGTTGGAIAVQATATATLRDPARLNAEGRAGGGTIAIGGGATAASEILAGARISADATGAGSGGKVTVLSHRKTSMAGRITARGGSAGGAGGMVEVSGSQGYTLTGAIDVSAVAGPAGTILLDPQDLVIVAGGADSAIFQPGSAAGGRVDVGNNGTAGTPIIAALDPAVFEHLAGNVVLQAARDLSVLSPVTAHASSLTMQAGRNLTVAAPVALVGGGTVTLSAAVAGFTLTPGYDPGGPLGVLAITAAGGVSVPDGTVALTGGAGGMAIDGAVLARVFTAKADAGGLVTVAGTASATSARLVAGAIAVPGSLSGADLLLDTTGGGTIDLSGRVAALGTLRVNSGAALTATGAIAAARLAGSAATASFSGGANAIASLGDFTAATSFDLVTTTGLLVAGRLRAGLSNAPDPVAGTAISLAAGGALAIGEAAGLAASINAATVALSAGGAITSPNGVVFADSLALAATGVDLPNANRIARLGAVAATGPVLVNDAVALDVTAPITLSGAGASLALLSAGTITVQPGATLSVPGELVLAAATLAVQAPLAAAGISLRGDALAIAAPLDAGAGTIELAPLAQGGTIVLGTGMLADAASLTAGRLLVGAAGGATRAGAIVVTGFDGTAIGVLELAATGRISQTGTLRATRLDLAGGSVALADPGNAIAILGQVAAGSLALATSGDLALAGRIAAGTVELRAAGALTQPGGGITADVLSGSAGSANLSGSNIIAALGGFTTSGDFAFATAGSLAVLRVVSAGGSAALDVGGDLAIGSSGRLIAGTLDLRAGGTIAASGAALATGLLTGSAARVSLPAANSVAALGNFSTTGEFVLHDTIGLTVTGTVTAGSSLTLAAFGPLAIGTAGAPARLAAGTIALLASGAITEATGSLISADLLTGSGASAALAGPNAVGALGGFTTSGDFSFASAGNLAISGIVSAGGAAPDPANAARLELDVPGSLTIGAGGLLRAGTLELHAGGAIAASGGAVAANLLVGDAARVDLRGPNAVAALGAFTTTGDFFLSDAVGLAIIGVVTAGPTLSLATSGALAIGGPGTPASLAAGAVVLAAAGAISEAAGSAITADRLTGSAASASLAGTNVLGTLGDFATAGDFALASAAALTVSGNVSAGAAARLGLAADGPITIAAPGMLSAGTVALSTAAAISAPGGVIRTGLLLGPGPGLAAASLSLPGANDIAAIGDFAVTGNMAVATTGGLAALGTLSAGGTLALAAGGGLALGGASHGVLEAPIVELNAGGLVSAPNGAIAAGLLTTGAGSVGAALLDGANSIATLRRFTAASGELVLRNTGALMVAGPVSVAGGASIATPDVLTIAGSIAASGIVQLAGDAGVLQTGGDVTGGIVSATAASGAFTQQEGAAMRSSGPGLTIAALGDIRFAGALDAPAGTVALRSAGAAITAAGGTITASTLVGSAFGAVRLDTANVIALLGDFTAGQEFLLRAGSMLFLAGTIGAGGDLAITAPGISQSAGTVTSGGALRLDGAGGISIAGTIATPGSLTLVSAFGGIAETGATARLAAAHLTADGQAGVSLDPFAGASNNTIGTLDLLAGHAGMAALSSFTPLLVAGAATGAASVSLRSDADLLLAPGIAVASTAGGVTLAAGRSLAIGAGAVASGATLSAAARDAIAIAGTLSADKLSIAAPTVQFTDGALLLSGAAAGTWPEFATATGGTFISSTDLAITGTMKVAARPGVFTPTLRIDLSGTGRFDTLGGLAAPSTAVFLDMGANATLSGAVNVAGLSLRYVRGGIGSADLSGIIRGVGGQAVAQLGAITAVQSTGYRINSCPIASVNCVVISSERLPAANPINDLDIRPARDVQDDADVLLPNVSTRDF